MPFHKETYLIAANRARFEPLIKFAIPTMEQIDQVDDKATLARSVSKRGLPIPKTRFRDSPDEFARSRGVPVPAFGELAGDSARRRDQQVRDSADAVATAADFANEFT